MRPFKTPLLIKLSLTSASNESKQASAVRRSRSNTQADSDRRLSGETNEILAWKRLGGPEGTESAYSESLTRLAAHKKSFALLGIICPFYVRSLSLAASTLGSILSMSKKYPIHSDTMTSTVFESMTQSSTRQSWILITF
jgi:hypothetical protein